MKKEKENYQSLIQMLRDFKIDEKEAAKIILSKLKSGRPKSTFKLDIYFSVNELMNKKKISRQSAIINFLEGKAYQEIKKKYEIKTKKHHVTRIHQMFREVESDPFLLRGIASLKKGITNN
jgi:hypothetical protein